MSTITSTSETDGIVLRGYNAWNFLDIEGRLRQMGIQFTTHYDSENFVKIPFQQATPEKEAYVHTLLTEYASSEEE